MGRKSKILLIATACVAIALAIVLIVSNSTSSRIKKVEKFTAKVAQEYTSYSASDLEKSQAKFDKIVSKAEKKELAGDQKRYVNQLKMECKGYFAHAKAKLILKDFNETLDEAGDDVKDAIENLQNK